MSKKLPDFRVNVAYRSVKVSKLFCFLAKPVTDKFEKCDLIYKFEINIGQTARMLIHRVREHRMPSCNSNICLHIHSCDEYIINFKNFVEENDHNFTSLKAKIQR